MRRSLLLGTGESGVSRERRLSTRPSGRARTFLPGPCLLAAALFAVACGGDPAGSDATDADESGAVAVAPFPPPSFHHIHVNSTDPERAIDWWSTLWPAGERTTVEGLPAFVADGVALVYTAVESPAPGGFDPERRQSIPQSPFWTTGPSTDGLALYERLTELDPEGERFGFLPVYTGPDDTEGVPHSGLAPFGDQLLTVAEMAERAAREGGNPTRDRVSGQDFGYLVDPDGILVEFNGNAETEDLFYGHTHFWHEQPLCASNWYAEHLGMTLPPQRDAETGETTPRAAYDPCDVEVGDVSYPSFLPMGQLRRPIGSVRLANAGWAWYSRQCRDGRCGPELDRPLVPSRGQVVDHVGISYPDLDPVLAHLEARGVPILEGPYPHGDTRAVLIEDLDGMALELIEAGP